ncbi:MAG: TonB-dependent receptor [Undibacterium sp.]|nr:TonB-dependent receptor [Opitutaceae bacterium]
MNPITSSSNFLRLTTLMVGVLLCAGQAAAQTTGTVEGRVLNADNGKYLNNARVTVDGTTLEAFTDSAGLYRLTNVLAGEAKVKTFYTGLIAQDTVVAVTAGGLTTLDVNLSTTATVTKKDEVLRLDVFKVAAAVEMDAASIAINEQRFSPTIKNVVSTDAFGDITEGNLGDFVKFLPGVTIDYVSPDARTISVRGVPANYTPVTLNGNRIASANSSSAGRTFELEQISINNAGRIEVLKSRSPETAADALGGAINLVPRRSFDQANPSFTYKAFVSANGDEKEFNKTRGPTNEASRKIKPGFDFVYVNPVSKTFGYILAVLESNIYYPQHRTQPNWAPNATAAIGPEASPTNPYLRSYQVQDGPKNNARKSISGTVDLRLNKNDTLSVGAQWNFYNASFSNRPVTYDVGSAATAAPASFTQDYTNGAAGRGSVNLGGTSFRHKYGYTYATDTTYVHNGPIWKIDGGLAFSHASNHYHDEQDAHFNGATLTLRGTPSLPAASSPTVNFAGIANGSYLQPTTITVLDTAGVDKIDLSNPANYNINNVNFNPADSADVFKTARVNAKRDLGFSFPLSIKAGLNLQEETRDIRLDNRGNWNFVGPDGVANTADDNASLYTITDPQYASGPFLFATPQVPYPDPYSLYSLFVKNPSYFALASAANPTINSATNSKYFREVISAAYIMADARMFSNRLRMSGGVRFERTQDKGYGVLNNPLAGYITNASGQPVLNPDLAARAKAQYKDRGDIRSKSYDGAYPSFDTSYNVTHNIVARAAYARSIGRPDLGNIIPSTTLPDTSLISNTYAITTVNAALKPTQTNAFDVSLEYYFAKTGVFSVGAFRKDFSDFVGGSVPQAATLALLQSLGIPDAANLLASAAATNPSALVTVATRSNVGTARVTGLEFNYSQVLDVDFLPSWTKQFTVYANGQQMHLEGSTLADFSNFIPASGSWGVKYSKNKFSAQVNWNYRGRQRQAQQSITYNGLAHTDNGFYQYYKPRIYTDINFNYRVSNLIGLFVNARNLTNVAQDQQRYGPGSPSWSRTYQREEFGVQYTIGVKGTF